MTSSLVCHDDTLTVHHLKSAWVRWVEGRGSEDEGQMGSCAFSRQKGICSGSRRGIREGGVQTKTPGVWRNQSLMRMEGRRNHRWFWGFWWLTQISNTENVFRSLEDDPSWTDVMAKSKSLESTSMGWKFMTGPPQSTWTWAGCLFLYASASTVCKKEGNNRQLLHRVQAKSTSERYAKA